jgi:hypothetical protein
VKRLAFAFVVGAAVALAVGTEVWRGSGSWSNGLGDYGVETLEATFGPWYGELVWGRYR